MALNYRLRLLAATSLLACGMAAHAQFNTWTYKAHMLAHRFDFAAAVGQDGKIYVFGGSADTQQTALDSAEVYDPATNSWHMISSMPTTRVCSAAVTGPDGKIYIVGGKLTETVGSAIPTSLLIYDPASDTYSNGPAVPLASFTPRCVLGADGQIYDFPLDGNTLACRFDPSLGTWSQASEPQRLQLPGVVAGPDGRIYITGGLRTTDFAPQATTYAVDPITDVWSSPPSLNLARRDHGAALGGDGRLYVLGGSTYNPLNNEQPDSLDAVEAHLPGSNAWVSAQHLLSSRARLATVSGNDGAIYALGGMQYEQGANPQDPPTATVLDTVESYLPNPVGILSFEVPHAIEGQLFTGAIGEIQTSTKTPNLSNYLVKVTYDDGTSEDGTLSLTQVPGQIAVSIAHVFPKAGPATISSQIFFDGLKVTTTSQSFTVQDAPLTGQPVQISATAQTLFTGTIAHFTDGDPNAVTTGFLANADWGDGSANFVGIVDDGAGGFNIVGSHTYAAAGTYTVVVSIADNGGAHTEVTSVAKVSDPAPVITGQTVTGTEGSQVTGVVASFTDANGSLTASSFSATIQWGDGTSGAGVVSSNGAGGFNVSGSHTYAEEGAYATSVQVTLSSGPSATGSGSALIQDAPITATGFDLICKGTKFSDTVATITDADPNGKASDFKAAIFWGDGKSSTGSVVAAGSGFKVVGSHTYLKKAKYTVTITIKDIGGASASAVTHINVGPVK